MGAGQAAGKLGPPVSLQAHNPLRDEVVRFELDQRASGLPSHPSHPEVDDGLEKVRLAHALRPVQPPVRDGIGPVLSGAGCTLRAENVRPAACAAITDRLYMKRSRGGPPKARWTVDAYETDGGDSPIWSFIRGLEGRDRVEAVAL